MEPTTFSFAHMPRQEGSGRLAQKGTGMVGAAYITALSEKVARRTFAELYPHREITAVGILGQESR